MDAILDAESTLTDRYQTTVPEPIRRVLGLHKADRIRYSVVSDGSVRLSRAGEKQEQDPVMVSFLGFLAKDIQANPRNVAPLSPDLIKRISSLTEGVEFDLNERLSPDDE